MLKNEEYDEMDDNDAEKFVGTPKELSGKQIRHYAYYLINQYYNR